MEVKVYDTTLRDGTQAEDISFSVADKLRITRKLDELGVLCGGHDHLRERRLVAVDYDVDLVILEYPEVGGASDPFGGMEEHVGEVRGDHAAAPYRRDPSVFQGLLALLQPLLRLHPGNDDRPAALRYGDPI